MVQKEIKIKNLEKENLEKENKLIKQDIELNEANKEIALLKASQFSAQQFEKITEIALIKTKIEQTKVWNGPINDVQTGFGFKADYYNDDALIVNTYNIDAKFGIDFSKIKIKKISPSKIQVAGLIPTYIGASNNKKQSIIQEIRRNDYDSNGNLKCITIKQDPANMRNASTIENELDQEYQESLQNMDNWNYLTDAIISLGQNFIYMIFGQIYKDIEFVKDETMDFVQMKDYIENEIKLNTNNKTKLELALPQLEKVLEG